jgi:hypothetical protein
LKNGDTHGRILAAFHLFKIGKNSGRIS